MNRLPSSWLDGMRLPLIAAPMFLVSNVDLVAAACINGVIGAFPTVNARTPEILDQWLADLTARLDAARAKGIKPAPFAVGLTTHSSNPRMAPDLALCVKYKVPLIITAMGSPKPAVGPVHDYGGLVFADVSTPDYARKAAAGGVDGLVLVGAGAGGHTGHIALPAFVAAVREFWDGIIVAAGSMMTGEALRAAQVMGADLAYMGTRFIATEESLADPRYKQMVVDCTVKDIVPTDIVTGAIASKLRPSLVNAGLDPDNLPAKKSFDLHYAERQPKAWKDIWSAGQGVGMAKSIEKTADVIDRLAREYAAAIRASHDDVWTRRALAAGQEKAKATA
ncbi:MAG: nitronate monooxygenase [Proteobacteria bacterium]|nr:nitronate monooxygenase [Pseudomonadota bacterium]